MSYQYSRRQLIKQASLTEDDFEQVKRRRRPENKLGFAYQIGFVRLHNRFPAQQPLEVIDELLAYTAIQIDIEADLIHDYSRYQPNVSAHQSEIREYLNLTSFTKDAAERLQDYIFEQACRLEHNVGLNPLKVQEPQQGN